MSLKGSITFVAPATQRREFHKRITTWIKILERVASVGESVKNARIMGVIYCYHLEKCSVS